MEFYENISKVQVDTMKWIGEVNNDLKLAGNTQETILNKDIFRIKVHKWQVDQEDKRKEKTGTTWTNERKKAHSQRMREFWIHRKTKKRL